MIPTDEQTLPEDSRRGVIGCSRAGRCTFTVSTGRRSQITVWWGQQIRPDQDEMTVSKFLRWLDSNNINACGREFIDPVAAAKKAAYQQTAEGQAEQAYWSKVKARSRATKVRRQCEDPQDILDRIKDRE